MEKTYTPLKVFIVGPPRSGTSIIFFALNKILTLPGLGESHVMPIFQKMIHEFRLYHSRFLRVQEELLIKQLSRDEFEQCLFDFIRAFYFKAHGAQSWVDKTPTDEATHGLPLIESIFPDARLIAMKRNGIEVVNSYIQKFNSSFAEACTTWANSMEGILNARDKCKNMLEVDQYDLANSPLEWGVCIANHLGRPEFSAELGAFFANERVEKTSSHDWRVRLTLSDVPWSEEQRRQFLDICGPAMNRIGYSP